MKIVPKKSFGPIDFTMTRRDVEKVFGNPDLNRARDEDGVVAVSYFDGQMELYFYELNNFKLSNIVIERGDIRAEYNGNNLFTMKHDDIVRTLKVDGEITELEENFFEDTGEKEEVIDFESLGIRLYFDENNDLSEISLTEGEYH